MIFKNFVDPRSTTSIKSCGTPAGHLGMLGAANDHMDSSWSTRCPGVVPGPHQRHGETEEAFRRAAWPEITNNQKWKKMKKSKLFLDMN